MQYGQRYRLLRVNGEVIEATHIQTKGNDIDYPTFERDEGGLIAVSKDNVLGPVTDDCPVDGIERPAFADNHIYGTQEGGTLEWDTNPVTIRGEIDTIVDRTTIPPKPESIITAIYKDDPNGYVKYEISEGQ